MDDFDIYDDLQLLQEQGKQKAEEDSQWKEKYHVALGTIEKLQTEKKELNKKIKQLETNFVSLLDTARAEIKRKDNQIAELRREKDDLCFRRVARPGEKRDYVPPSSRNEHGNRFPRDVINTSAAETKSTFASAGSPGYTKFNLKNDEENKGNWPDKSGQNRNSFQGGSSVRLGTSGDKNYNERHSTKQQNLSHNKDLNSVTLLDERSSLKQETLEENKNNRMGNLRNNVKEFNGIAESEMYAKCEKIMEEDILKDLKEFKKRKHCDAKKDLESEESTLKVSNEKANMFFDALFDDLGRKKESSEIKETEIIYEAEMSTKATMDADNCIVETNFLRKKMSKTGATPKDDVKFGNKQVNSNEIDKTELNRFEKKHNLSPKIPASESTYIFGDSVGGKNNDKKTKISESKFAEQESSLYSSDEGKGGEKGKGKLSASANSSIVSNLNDLNEIMVMENGIEDTSENKNKLSKSLLAKCLNNNEILHKKGHANEESKSKNLQIEREENILHTLEQKEIQSGDDISPDFFKRSNRSKHHRSSSYSKSHRHGKESRDNLHSDCSSKTSINSSSRSKENKNKRKYEHDLEPKDEENNPNEKRKEEVNVALETLVQSKDLKKKAQSNNNKKLKKIASLDLEKISDDDEEIFEKITEDDIRGSNVEKYSLIEKITDKSPEKEIKDDLITELKPFHIAIRKTDELKNKVCPKNDTVEPTENKNYEEQKSEDPESQNMRSNTDMLTKDEFKNVVKQKRQTGNEHFLQNTNMNARKCDKSKKEDHNFDLILSMENNSDKVEKRTDEISISKNSVCNSHIDVNSRQNSIDSSKDMQKSSNLSDLNCELETKPIKQAIDDCKINSTNEIIHNLAVEKKQSADSDVFVANTHHDENSQQNVLKSNQANENDGDSTTEKCNVTTSTEPNILKKSNVSNTHELKTCVHHPSYNKMKHERDANKPKEAKVTIVESDVDENEHLEMPPLLVEEEPEDAAAGEKLIEIKSNSENIDVPMSNIVTSEKRIHHKKRMLQNSRTAEHVKNISSIQSDGKVPTLGSNHQQISIQSVISDGTTGDKHEINSKMGLDSSNSVDKQSYPLESSFSAISESSGHCIIKSVEKCDSKERYKKKILQKYKNFNKIVENTHQCDSSITLSCDTNATSSLAQCSNNNNHTDDLDKLMDISIITKDKDNVLTSENSEFEVSVTKEHTEGTDSHILYENNVLRKCNKFKEVKNTPLSVQCEKRKLPLISEPETLNNSIISKSTAEQIGKNPKTNILQDSMVSPVPNMGTADMIAPETGKVSTHLDSSSEPCSIVRSENVNKEQSNEISSQSLVKNKESLNIVDCIGNLTKTNIISDRSLNECPVKKEDGIQKTKSKEKNLKRKCSLDTEIVEEKTSKRTKKMDSNKLKSLSSNSKKPITHTENKEIKPSPSPSSSPEKTSICLIDSNLIHHNIFSNDGCPDDRNLPAICNDNDVQYQEIDNRLRSMFHSPTYKPPTMENIIDPNCDTSPQGNDIILNHTLNETLNKSEKSQCDTSSSSRKISVGSNDYVIEKVGAHVANVFVTRKKCKKRAKIAVATV